MSITNNGVALAAGALLASSPSYIGIGTGTTPATPADTALDAEVGADGLPGDVRSTPGSARLTTTTLPDDTLSIGFAFTSRSADPFDVTEVGLFDADGNLIARTVLTEPRTVAPGGVMQVRTTWQIQGS